MAAGTSEESIINGWMATCYLIAMPIVFFIGNDVYAGIGILSNLVATAFANSTSSVPHWFAPPTDHAPTFGEVMFGLLVGVPVLLVLLVVGLFILIPAAILFYVAQWLITNTGNGVHDFVHLVFDVILVVVFGGFLYGVFFPLVWLVTEPLLAHTFGEITFQRVRYRVYGNRPRFARPAYLLVALLSFGFAGARMAAPVAQQGAEAWRAEVQEVYFPPTPVPTHNDWPKVFTVPGKQVVHTGIQIPDKDFEVLVHTNRHVFVTVDNLKSGSTFVRGQFDSSPPVRLGFAATGELLFRGADEPATVSVLQPQFAGRTWLQPGQTYRTHVWVDPDDDGFGYCGGVDLSYRTVSTAGTSSWTKLDPGNQDYWTCGKFAYAPARGGQVEFKALRTTWLGVNDTLVRPYFKTHIFFPIPAGRLFDTRIPIRKGDRFRVEAGNALYAVLSSGHEVLIPGDRWGEMVADARSTVRVKGGVLDSGAKVTLVARGPEWK